MTAQHEKEKPPMAERAHSGTFEHEAPKPGPEHARLEVFIGKWINEGETIATPDPPAAKILTSDVYDWVPGGFFVLHTAYGRLGDLDVGGVELIGYDAKRGVYTSHFFDSQGNVTVDDLIYEDGTWTWQGDRVRTFGEFSDDGKTQRARHENSDDGVEWRPSMDVTLRKVE
jgi:Protein of unknown function (DUF1579)